MGILFKVAKQENACIGSYVFSTKPIGDDENLAQIYPAGAENNPKFFEEADSALTNPGGRWVYQTKFDGERLLLHFKDGYVRATTRRQSVKTGRINEKTDNIPHIRGVFLEELNGTVLDGEIIVHSSGKSLSNTQSVMNSIPETAINLQKSDEWATFHCFDILMYRGDDIRTKPLWYRLNIMERCVRKIQKAFPDMQKYIKATPVFDSTFYKLAFEEEVAKGGEGLVLKNMDSFYGEPHSWVKMKKVEFVDAFVTGWEKGQGRNSDVCGYLKFSVWNSSNTGVVEIARVGALTDDIRRRVAANFDEFKGMVAELKMQEVTDGYRLRHPRINRWRPDKSESQCSIEQLERLK